MVNVLLDGGVARGHLPVGVGLARVQAVSLFPFVRHAVVVGVGRRCRQLQAVHVPLVGGLERGVSPPLARAVADLLDGPPGDAVAGEASGPGQDERVRLLGRVGGDGCDLGRRLEDHALGVARQPARPLGLPAARIFDDPDALHEVAADVILDLRHHREQPHVPRAGAALVVVVDEVDRRHPGPSLPAEALAEVVHDVVAEVSRPAWSLRHQGGAAPRVVRQQVMMQRDVAAGQQRAVVVEPALLVAFGVGLLDGAPLDGRLGGAGHVDGLVVRPGQRDVIEDDVAATAHLHGVAAVPEGSVPPDAQEADHDLLQRRLDAVLRGQHPLDGDPAAGCRLPGDGDEGLGDGDVAPDDAADFEDDDARPFGLAGGLEAAGALGLQVGDLDDLAAPPADGRGAEALRAGKGRRTGQQRGQHAGRYRVRGDCGRQRFSRTHSHDVILLCRRHSRRELAM